MMTGSVLDILIYVFDRFMFDEAPEVPARPALEQHLTFAGFAQAHVQQALDWLADLAFVRDRPPVQASPVAMRVYCDCESTRLSCESRGFLFELERQGVLSIAQREVVIERMLALQDDEIGLEQSKWVVLMVLSTQPGQERACAQLQELAVMHTGRLH